MPNSIDSSRNEYSVLAQRFPAHTLLIIEDDKPLLQRLARAMEARGFKVTTAQSVADGLAWIKLSAPAYAVVDMRLEDGCGLDVISVLKQQRPDARIIIQSGYGNIPTAVRHDCYRPIISNENSAWRVITLQYASLSKDSTATLQTTVENINCQKGCII